MTETIFLAADDDGIDQAAALLRDGKLVAFETETVYGLGADATNDEAVAAIYTAKGRPAYNPLICHIPDTETAWTLVQPTELARTLAAQFWPGPLTLVLPRQADCPVGALAAASLGTLGVRVPSSDIARDLLRRAGCPVAAPSANRSGRISPTCAEHVMDELNGAIAAVLDSGPSTVGVESTVLDLSGPHPLLLRAGGVSLEALIEAIGPVDVPEAGGPMRSPGMMQSHYAPSLPIRLNVSMPAPDEALLGFGPMPVENDHALQLSETRNLAEAASNLFAGLRAMDRLGTRLGLRGIAVMPIPQTGLGLAINDRLRRAAAPRPSEDVSL